eukprot:2710960-Prymnesium_polylepis.1
MSAAADANAARTGRPALMCAVLLCTVRRHRPQPLAVARRCGGGAGAPVSGRSAPRRYTLEGRELCY